MQTPTWKILLAMAGAALAAAGATAATAAPQYIHYEGVDGRAKAGKTTGKPQRPNVAAGDVNGDGHDDLVSHRSATLRARKAGEGQTANKPTNPAQAGRSTGLLLPAVQGKGGSDATR